MTDSPYSGRGLAAQHPVRMAGFFVSSPRETLRRWRERRRKEQEWARMRKLRRRKNLGDWPMPAGWS